MPQLDKAPHAATVRAIDGRHGGASRTDDGRLDVRFSPPGAAVARLRPYPQGARGKSRRGGRGVRQRAGKTLRIRPAPIGRSPDTSSPRSTPSPPPSIPCFTPNWIGHDMTIISATATTYRAVQATERGKLELVRRKLEPPTPGAVRIRVEACGVCHSDAFTVEGSFPGLRYPRVPGHEVVGRIDALGEGVLRVGRGATSGRRILRWSLRALRAVSPRRSGELPESRHRRRDE